MSLFQKSLDEEPQSQIKSGNSITKNYIKGINSVRDKSSFRNMLWSWAEESPAGRFHG